jgi:hypothetical protein
VAGRPSKPPLTAAQILAWADAHHARTGAWPAARSGPVEGAPGESWKGLDRDLRHGHRGLPGGDSLHRLLRRERGAPERPGAPRVSEADRRLAAALRAEGLTLAAVGRRLGVSKQRVHQLLRTAGVKEA